MELYEMLARFEETVELGDGETVASFAARLASLWNAATAQQFWEDVGVSYLAMCAGDVRSILALARVSGADAQALFRWSPIRIGKAMYGVGGEVLSSHDFQWGKTRFCVPCARENIVAHPGVRPDQAVHGRLAWQVLPLMTCAIHGVPLVHVRSDLPAYFGLHDFGLRAGAALADLDALDVNVRPREFSSFERYFLDRLEGRITDFPLLDKLRLYRVSTTCLAFGRVLLHGPQRAFEELSEQEIHASYDAGFRLLREGKGGLVRFCEALLRHPSARLSRSYTPRGTLGRPLDWLLRIKGEPELDELKTMLAESIFETFPMAGGEELFGVKNTKPAFHTVHDVHRKYGVHWSTVARVAKLSGMGMHFQEGRLKGPLVLRAADAKRLFETFSDVVGVGALSGEIGATRGQLAALTEAGILQSAFPNSATLSFRRIDVEAFIAALSERTRRVAERKSEMVSLRRAAWRSSSKMVDLVKGILAGKISWMGCLCGGKLMDSIVVLRREIPRPDGSTDPKVLTQENVSRRWLVRDIAIGGLVALHELEPHVQSGQGRSKCITEKSVHRFERKYISLKAAAQHRGEFWPRTMGLIERAGIQAAFPELRGRFYAKSALKRAGIL